jgi:hypothetical protein
MNKLSFIILISSFLISCNAGKAKADFDSKKWQSSKGHRYLMLDDLVARALVINKSPADVVKLLGRPDNRQDSLDQWTYGAGGVPSGLGIKIYTLSIQFKQGKVAAALVNEFQD